jgi:hypothetical protein
MASVATPALLIGAVPIAPPNAPPLEPWPKKNTIEPVGVPVAPVTTVAVNVMDWPELEGLTLEVMVTEVSFSRLFA